MDKNNNPDQLYKSDLITGGIFYCLVVIINAILYGVSIGSMIGQIPICLLTTFTGIAINILFRKKTNNYSLIIIRTIMIIVTNIILLGVCTYGQIINEIYIDSI